MNSNYQQNNQWKNKGKHAISFSNVHPVGGFVAWPDGSDTRIGESRRVERLSNRRRIERKGFVAWPAKD